MHPQLEEIRDKQKASWNKFSAGWKKWDSMLINFMQPMANEMITMLKPVDGDIVLDIASGTGEPGITIAGMIGNGKVVSTDVAEDMLTVAAAKAKQRGIDNFKTVAADVCELPFDDAAFTAITCRFGFMFFPDMLMAAKEMHRVLQPDGRMVTAVWNIPEKNFWVTAMMSAINKNLDIPAPPAGAPGMFRCAANDVMKNIFVEAGFSNIRQTTVDTMLPCDTNETFWNMHNEVAAPVVAALAKADDDTKEKIKREVYEKLDQKFKGQPVHAEASAIIIYAEK